MKKREKVIKIRGVKLNCEILKNLKGEKNQKIIINQTIYYQVLKNRAKINKNNTLVYTALVNEKNKNIKAKILSKIKIEPYKKVDGKIYFKNNNKFKINNNEKIKILLFTMVFKNNYLLYLI